MVVSTQFNYLELIKSFVNQKQNTHVFSLTEHILTWSGEILLLQSGQPGSQPYLTCEGKNQRERGSGQRVPKRSWVL